jgi:hypothetical protein
MKDVAKVIQSLLQGTVAWAQSKPPSSTHAGSHVLQRPGRRSFSLNIER